MLTHIAALLSTGAGGTHLKIKKSNNRKTLIILEFKFLLFEIVNKFIDY